MTAHPPLHNPDRKPTATAAGTRAARRKRNAGLTPEEMCRQMPAAELAHNARKGGVTAIAEQERRRVAEDGAPAPLWMQARRDEIQRINDANEYDIGSIENCDPDR